MRILRPGNSMPILRPGKRKAFSLLELLVVMAIIGIMIGLVTPAMQRLRDSANRTHCFNNLRQLVLAAHDYNDTRGALPPMEGPSGLTDAGSVFFHLLPYIEQSSLYNAAVGDNPTRFDPQIAVDGTPAKNHAIGTFICLSDASYAARDPGGDWSSAADGCYAGNFQVFGKSNSAGNYTNGDWQGESRIPASFPDGTANTLLIAEKYSNCDGPDLSGTVRQGGNLWAGHGGDTWSPAFAVPNLGSNSTGPGSYFQTRPDDYVGGCDPSLASAGHTQGMTVGVADGSARLLSKNMSSATWWAICTPAGDEVLAADW